MELTKEEQRFIIDILGQITIKAADPQATSTTAMVQSIIAKLTTVE